MRTERAEIKNLIDNNTFSLEDPGEDDKVIPTMTTYKTKIISDGTIDKLKCLIVVRGHMQGNSGTTDTWTPTASTRLLRIFCAEAAWCAARIKQLDFVGAFLQARTRSHIFVKLPAKYGELYSEFSKYCGCALRLLRSMYETTTAGKNWVMISMIG